MVQLIDCLKGLRNLDDNSIDSIITSPPYNKKGLLGNVNVGNQIWSKFNIDYNSYGDDMSEIDYQHWMITVLNECHRVLKPNGSIFFNHKPRRHKNRCYLPTDFIQHSNANLYQVIIWNRRSSPNIRKDVLVPCTEYIYWLCKDKPVSYRDQLDREYLTEVWTIPPSKQKNHPAPFAEQVVINCINLSTKVNDIVLDPFAGSGTTNRIAESMQRQSIGFEIDHTYCSQL